MAQPADHEIRQGYCRILDRRADVGAAKIIGNWFLESPNIFDPRARRKPKPEFVLVLAYILMMALVCAAFNLGGRP
jgi:hypothetical protein